MNEAQLTKTITFKGTSEGIDKLTADLNKLASATENVAVVTEKAAPRIRSTEEAYKRQTLRLDEAARAQDQIARATKLADAALRENVINQQQHVERLQLIQQRYGTATQATQKFAQQTGLARHELINLGRQAQDVGVSLASGQSPFMVMVQQGTQIADVFATSGGTVRGFFTQAIGFAGRFVASAAGVATAVGSIAAGLLYAASSADAAQKAIDKVLTSGPGAASGLSRGGLNQIAQGAAGSGMDIKEARAAALEFAKTGQIYEANIKSATEATRLFVQAAGIDAADASKQLAKALVDPSQGAQELNKQFGFLDATLLNHIRTLQSQGKLQEAQAALLAGLTPTLKQQADTVDFLTAAWRKADQSVIDFNKSIDNALGLNKDLATQLDEAVKKQQEAGGRASRGVPFGAADLRAATAEVERLTKAMADLNARTEAQRLKDLSNIADAFTRALIPSIEQVEKLTLAITKMKEAQAAGVGGRNTGAAIDIAQMQLSIAKETMEVEQRKAQVFQQNAAAYSGVSALTAQTLAAMKDQLNVASAVTGIAQINAQHQATINQLLREGKSLTDAIAIADAQRAVALAQVNAEAQRTLKQLQQENELINAAPGLMQDMVRARQTYNNLIDQGVDKTLAEAVANQQLKNAIDQRAQAHKTAMISLEGQLSVAQAISGVEQIEAQYLANINNLLRQGFTLAQATAQAEMQRAAAYAQVEANAERRLIQLQREYDVIVATSEAAKEAARARNTYNELIDQGVSSGLARRVADQQQANESSARRQREYAEEIAQSEREAADEAQRAAQAAQDLAQANAAAAQEAARLAANYERAWEALKFIPFGLQDVMAASRGMDITAGLYQSKQGGYSQFNPAGYQQQLDPLNLIYSLTNKYGAGGFDPQTGAPNAQGLAYAYGGQFSAGTPSASGLLGIGLTSTRYIDKMPQRYFDPQRASLIQRGIELMPKEQQLSAYQQLLEMAKGAPGGIEQAELVKSLNDKIEQLIRATDENTSATQAMTDVLSPFYSSDPRRTHLGFRAFAGGGIMSSIGELPMMSASTHRGGGITNTPQAAMFGEGSVPEAYVPVPSGRIPVVISGAANSNQRPINVRITVMGNADSATVAGLKQTAFQRVQALRRMGG